MPKKKGFELIVLTVIVLGLSLMAKGHKGPAQMGWRNPRIRTKRRPWDRQSKIIAGFCLALLVLIMIASILVTNYRLMGHF